MAVSDPRTEAVAAADRYGIPRDLFLGLIQTESGFDATAANPASSAYGYTQLLAGTARDLGVDRFDPAQNLDGGARYLAQQYKRFGDYETALAAYYQGPGSVQRYGVNADGARYAAKVKENAAKQPSILQRAVAGAMSPADFAKGIVNGVLGRALPVPVTGAQGASAVKETFSSLFPRVAIAAVALILIAAAFFLSRAGGTTVVTSALKNAAKAAQ